MFGKTNGKEPGPAPMPGDGIIRMVIEFKPGTEGCQVTGPLKSPSLCYMMLEMARDVIHSTAQEMKNAKMKLSAPPPGFDPTRGGPEAHG